MITIFGFYTDDAVYTKHAMILKESAKKFNIEINLHKVSKGDWQTIIAYKPSFIAEMRRKLDGPILYIDVDAILLDDIQPYFENITEDIAVHYINGTRLISGTIFLNDTPNAYLLVDEWERRMKETPEIWDQIILHKLLDEWIADKKIEVYKMSASYVFIYDTSFRSYGNSVPPIIEHFQASRDKRWLKKYKERSPFQQWLMRIPYLKRSTRKIMERHQQVNKRTKELDIDMRISLNDLLI